jgi:hypothetical protein
LVLKKRATIDHKFLETLFTNEDGLLKKITHKLNNQKAHEVDNKRSNFLVFENANHLIKHFDDNPFQLLKFINECNRRAGDYY